LTELRKKFKRFILFLKDISPFLLSHHPLCSDFDEHVYKLGKRRFCVGCFTLYPTLIIMLIILGLMQITNLFSLFILLLIGLGLLSSILLNLLGLTEKKFAKVISKVLLGASFACLIYSIFSFPIFPFLKILFLFAVSSFIGSISLYRVKSLEKTCKECKFGLDQDNCDGFKEVNEKLIRDGFKK